MYYGLNCNKTKTVLDWAQEHMGKIVFKDTKLIDGYIMQHGNDENDQYYMLVMKAPIRDFLEMMHDWNWKFGAIKPLWFYREKG